MSCVTFGHYGGSHNYYVHGGFREQGEWGQNGPGVGSMATKKLGSKSN